MDGWMRACHPSSPSPPGHPTDVIRRPLGGLLLHDCQPSPTADGPEKKKPPTEPRRPAAAAAASAPQTRCSTTVAARPLSPLANAVFYVATSTLWPCIGEELMNQLDFPSRPTVV